ncbi:hypothetical protein NL676_038158 [Syzygium grande]|nr:hypothetical protein NL676_038158 [Syzygium grande]
MPLGLAPNYGPVPLLQIRPQAEGGGAAPTRASAGFTRGLWRVVPPAPRPGLVDRWEGEIAKRSRYVDLPFDLGTDPVNVGERRRFRVLFLSDG